MLQTVATSVLNKVIGSYVEKFDKDNVDLNIWQGQAKLAKVQLKPDSLDFLGLPVAIKIGYVGLITLNVDWKHLSSKPAIVEIEDVRIVAGPRSKFKVNEKDEEEKALSARQQTLAAWEGFKLQRDEDGGDEKDKESSSSMVEKIIDNVIVRIKKVHVRYEDDEDGQMYSLGFSIESLSAETTDENWVAKFVEAQQFVYKHVKLKKFGLYLNTRAIAADQEYLADFFDYSTARSCRERKEFVLQPMSGHVKLTMNKDIKKLNYSEPQFKIDAHLDQIAFLLSEAQYNGVLAAVSSISIAQRYGRYLRYRPDAPVTRPTAKIWWKHAIQCTIRELPERMKLNWNTMKERRRDKKLYIDLYTRTLNTSWLKELGKEEKEQMDKYEAKYSLDDLMLFRSCAIKEVQSMLPMGKYVTVRGQDKEQGSGWFSGWGKKKKPIVQELSGRERQAIYRAASIEYLKTIWDESESDIPKDFAVARVNFELGKIGLCLLSDVGRPLVELITQKTVVTAVKRPGGLLAGVQMQDFYGLEHIVQHSQYAKFISRKEKQKSDKALLSFSFEMNPLDGTADNKIKLRTQALEVVVVKQVLDRVAEFFTPKRVYDLHAIEAAAFEELENIKNATQMKLSDALKDHQITALDFSIAAPQIIVPQNPTQKSSTVLVLDLGHLLVNTVFQPQDSSFEDKKTRLNNIHGAIQDDGTVDKQILADFYDAVDVRTRDIKLYLNEDKQGNRLIEPFTIDVKIYISIFPFEPVLPMIAIDGALPSLKMEVSSSNFQKLMTLLQTVVSDTAAVEGKEEKAVESSAPKPTGEIEKIPVINAKEMLDLKQKQYLMKKVQAMLNFKIPEITINIINDSSQIAAPHQVMVMRINNVTAQLKKRTYDLDLKLGLNSLFVEDCYASDRHLVEYLVQTSEQKVQDADNFILIRYQMVDSESPEYCEVDSEIDADFGAMIVTCNPESILKLLGFMKEDLLPASTAQTVTALAAESAPSEVKLEEKLDLVDENINRTEHVKMKVRASFKKLKVILNASDENFAEAYIANMGVSFTQYALSIDLSLKLGEMVMLDLTDPGYKHKHIIQTIHSSGAKNLVDLKLATYSDKELNFPGHYTKIEGHINGMKFRFLMRFIDELTKYVMTGPLGEVIFGAASVGGVEQSNVDRTSSAAIKAAPSQPKPDDKPKNSAETFPKIDLIVSEMDLIVPQSSNSDQVLRMSLSFSMKTEMTPEEDRIAIKMAGFTIEAHLNDSEKGLDFVLLPSLGLTMTEAMMTMDIELHNLEFKLGQAHYIFLMAMLSGNFGEKSILMEDLYGTRKTIQEAPDSDFAVPGGGEEVVEISTPPSRTIRVKLDTLNMELRKRHGVERKDHLVKLMFRKFETSLEMKPNGAMELHTGFYHMDMSDKSLDSEERGVHEQFLSLITLSDTSQEPFAVDFSSHPDTGMNVDVKILRLQLSFGGILWSLISFFTLPAAPSKDVKQLRRAGIDEDEQDFLDAVAELPSLETDELPELESSQESAPEEKPAGTAINVSVEMRDSLLRTVADPLSSRSTALILTWGFDMVFKMLPEGDMDLNSHIKETKAFAALIDVSKEAYYYPVSSINIMDPVNIDLNLTQRQSTLLDNEPSLKADLDMDFVNVRFTYRDFLLLTNSINAMIPANLGEESKDDSAGSPIQIEEAGGVGSLETQEAGRQVRRGEEKFDDEETDMNLASLASIQTVMGEEKDAHITARDKAKASTFGEQEVTLKIKGAKVMLINNVLNSEVPILQLKVGQLQTDLQAFGDKRTITSGLVFHSDYYNNRLATWEPMIEPWRLDMKILQTDSTTAVDVHSNDDLNINFTHSMVENLTESINLVTKISEGKSDGLEAKDDEGRDVFFTHHFQNLTEIPVKFSYLGESEMIQPNDKKGFNVKSQMTRKDELRSVQLETGGMDDGGDDDDEKEIRLSNELREEERLAGPEDVVHLQLGGDWESIRNVDIRKASVNAYFLRSLSEDESTPKAKSKSILNLLVIAELTIVDGQKTLLLHSSVCIINHTPVQIQVIGGAVNSGKTRWLPIKQARSESIRFRPRGEDLDEDSSDETHEWSPLFPLRDAKPTNFQFSCLGNKPYGDYHFAVQCAVDAKEKCVKYHIYPQIIVENLLSAYFQSSISSRTGDIDFGLKRGHKKATLQASHASELKSMVLHDFGVEWNGSLPFSKLLNKYRKRKKDSQEAVVSEKLSMVDQNGKILNICVEIGFPDGPGVARLYLYSRYWLFDLTNLNLWFSEDKENLCGGHHKHLRNNNRVAQQCEDSDTENSQRLALMFDFDKSSKHKLYVCANGPKMDLRSKWSRGIPIDAVGDTGALEGVVVSKNGKIDQLFEVGVYITQAPGWFYRTRVITFLPRFVLVNRLKHNIEYKQKDEEKAFTLRKGDMRAFHWNFEKSKHEKDFKPLLAFRPKVPDWDWSSFVALDHVGEHVLRLTHPVKQPDLVSLQIAPSGATIYVIFGTQDQDFSPFRIENRTLSETFRFCQKGLSKWRTVKPGDEVAYAWDDPYFIDGSELDPLDIIRFGEKKQPQIHVELLGGEGGKSKRKPHYYRLDDLSMSDDIDIQNPKRKVYIFVEPDGPTNVFVLSDFPNKDDDDSLVAKNTINRGILKKKEKNIRTNIQKLNKKLNVSQTHLKRSSSAEKEPRMEITISECRGLLGLDFGNRSDPFVEVILDNRKPEKTSVKKKNLNPIFNRKFVFPCPTRSPEPNHLKLTVYNHNTFSADDFLGELYLNLQDPELGVQNDFGESVDQWFKLQRRNTKDKISGDVHLKIHYVRSDRDAAGQDVADMQDTIRQQVKVLKNVRRRLGLDKHGNLLTPEREKFLSQKMGFPEQEVLQAKYVFKIHDVQNVDETTGTIVCLVKFMGLQRKIVLMDKGFPVESLKSTDEMDLEFFYAPELEVKTEDLELEVLHFDKQKNTRSIGLLRINLIDVETEAERLQRSDESGEPTRTWRILTTPIVRGSSFEEVSESPKLLISLEQKAPVSSLRVPQFLFDASLSVLSISIVDKAPRELLYLAVIGTKLRFQDAIQQQTVEFKLGKLQVDSQMQSSSFPILLTPTPVPMNKLQPFLQVSLNKSKLKNSDAPIHVFAYTTFLLQEMDIEVEENLIWALIEFVNEFTSNELLISNQDDLETMKLVVKNREDVFTPPLYSETKLFYQWLQIQPLSVNLSLITNPSVRDKHEAMSFNPFAIVLRAFGAALGSIDAAPIRLNALVIENAYGSVSSLLNPIISHYTKQGLSEIYKIMGSFEILGNPVQLVGNLGTGVMDFFYEPAQGLVKSPQDFAVGLSRGTISLLKNTFSGVFGAASKITGSVGKGVAMLSMDDEYIQEREAKKKKPPKHVGEGIADGVLGLGKGIFRGVTGVIVDPIKGAQRGGLGGFAKGVGTGLLGVVSKPTAGVIDLASSTLGGIGNTANLLDNSSIVPATKARLPRYLPESGMNLFAPEEALAQTVLWKIPLERDDKIITQEEKMKQVIYLNESSYVLICSNLRIVQLELPDRRIDLDEEKGVLTEAKVFYCRNISNVRKQVGRKLGRNSEEASWLMIDGTVYKKNLLTQQTSEKDLSIKMPCSPSEAAGAYDDIRSLLGTLFPKIRNAMFGVRDHWLDVTNVLDDLIKNRKIKKLTSNNVNYQKDLFGRDQRDPFPDHKKVLVVRYGHGVNEKTKVFYEDEPIVL